MSPTPIPGPDAQRAAVDELRKAEYHRDDPGVFERAVRWVLDHIGELLSGSGTGGGLWVFAALLLATVVVAIVLARRSRHRRVRTAAGRETDPLRPIAARDHRRLALDLAARGEWEAAQREFLRAAVQTIEERGLLDPVPGRTGAAVAREVGPVLPEAAGVLREAVAAFDEVWFGGRTATQDDARTAERAANLARTAKAAATPAHAGGYAVPS